MPSVSLFIDIIIQKKWFSANNNSLPSYSLVIRCILIRDNKILDQDEQGALKGAHRERIEEFARLEGITIEEAMERKKGFRYLY